MTTNFVQRPRYRCPHCNRMVLITRRNRLREHAPDDVATTPCPGSGTDVPKPKKRRPLR